MSRTNVYRLSAHRLKNACSISDTEVKSALFEALSDLGLELKPWSPSDYLANESKAPWIALTLDLTSDQLARQPDRETFGNETILSLNYSAEDIRDLADEAGVSEAIALARIKKWRRQIEETVATLCDEKLANAVESDCP